MSRVSVSGYALITENDEGIWVLGIRKNTLMLLNLKSLLVSDIYLHYKEEEPSKVLWNFQINAFHRSIKIEENVMTSNFETVKVEINIEKNELYFI